MNIANGWLNTMLGRMFQPISQPHAIQIAARATKQPENVKDFECYATRPSRFHLYLTTSEPCWYISVPWNDGKIALRDSRIVLVGKLTGMVHYDGCAGDEG